MQLQDISIRRKLFILVTLMMLSIATAYIASLWLSHNDMIESRKNIIRSVVESTVSQLQPILSSENSDLSEAAKLAHVKQLIYTLRYDTNNYLFLYDTVGNSIAHPISPELEDTNLSQIRDRNGAFILQPMLQGVRETGDVFWHYYWPHPGKIQLDEKLGYAKQIPGTDWIIGTGAYIDDLQNIFISRSITYALMGLFSVLLAFLISGRIANSITKPTARLVKQIDRLTSGHINEIITDAERKDEIGSIAKALIHFRDQTIENNALRSAYREAQYRETYDPETQLLTRKAMNDELNRALEKQSDDRIIAILIIKIPLLRDILAQWGSAYCNEVLMDISQRIKPTLNYKALLSRHADDSIALILNDLTDISEVSNLISTVQNIIMQPSLIDGQEVSFQSQIGVSTAPIDGNQESLLISHAEEALNEARRLEQDSLFFSQLKTFALDERLELWRDIQKAIEHDQFYLVFQPLYDLQTNQLISAEVLLRWEHPEHGFISPARFVPFAEQSGLVSRLDTWVLKAAAKQIYEWMQAGVHPPHLAINLSGLTFMNSDLKKLIHDATDGYDIPLNTLELELTEGVLIASIETLQDKINTVQEMGISISIDDFGTGYSSLSRIRNLQINKLKIDQSFIENLAESQGDKKIITAIITMAQGLGVKVVAEGVETPEQLNILRTLNCDIVQGFLLSKPLKREAFMKLLENQNLIIEID
ncbi:EAL domain-containing protein [Neptunomonas antarctica]|uniref:Diguanylate cyclase (GGDEF) domain-containing protein n=1 Tax=Neptunomonas antarctica TaxID=619304 RepID=A0A1N7J1A2_9GAMM|nr:EAL domain-containing protein [Neptunomonas antarctica]SIS43162.1 diguanylate cyclase (GGDEF) domain-containing protein [Neptunomonas antarctica]